MGWLMIFSLSVTALAARCPVVVAPAMDGGMYQHPATQANIATLRQRGVTIIEPDTGRFASGFVGQGRLPETTTLIGHIRLALGRSAALAGKHVIVTAGGTHEAIDPVRVITNRSSGKQGYALAQAALDAGAAVTRHGQRFTAAGWRRNHQCQQCRTNAAGGS